MSKPFYLEREHPAAVAHRGSLLLWPENTLTAFQEAANLGYRFFETDLQLSKDGVVMLFHDRTLERTTNGKGPVSNLTAAELRRLDAAYNFNPQESFPLRGKGITIPTLEEMVAGFPEAHIILEIKRNGLERPLLELIERANLWDRTIIGSLRGARLKRLRAATPQPITTAATPGEIVRVLTAARLGQVPRIAGDLLVVPRHSRRVNIVNPRTLKATKAAGLPVIVWTINQKAEMEELLDMGVDGLITDRPDLLRELMIERKRGGPWNQNT